MIIGVENLMKIEYDIKDLLCRACLRSAKFSAITIVRLLALNRRTWFNVFRQCRSPERYKQPPAMRVRVECYTKTLLSVTMRMFRPYCRRKESFIANQYNSLAHTKWLCKYHIVIVPKYRRKAIYNQYRARLRDIIRTLCKYKGVEILEGHMMPDHVHLLLSIPPKTSVSSFMGYLKGKSALMMF